eukprot:7639216-Karenia_brevis.AAC.1
MYRLWAKTRLTQLEPWINSWTTEHMNAGRKGAGAEQAWYLTAEDCEYATLTGSPVIVGTLDLFKCFDQ